ncbi:HTH-type transcriptional regulator MlrA [Vibrio stylophorae]|uniref:HTH-type transcriptional regulator MlrA n=1 Tax=Vibrio stylophorae TaxID=659351 RepID=A0ABM8ZX39_9VIBR|nr:MerR family transcriptional regulator [Vibrio stylophorae]CAH0535198.1 HTH-type transcriptional regulator MlrA [Vibrio stylophorae]
MDSNAPLYAIRDVASMTGVNPVTLRAWQRRYGLINPQRSGKGHRLYSEQDLQNIRQIMALLEKGIAIRHVKSLLEKNLDGDDLLEGDLAQAKGIYDALAAKNLGRAMQLLNEAIKEYPIQVVHERLFTVLEQWLNEPPLAGSEIVKSLWHHCIYNRAQFLVQASLQQGSEKLYLVLMQGSLAHLGWWHALLLSQQGWQVIVLEGMREQLNTLDVLLEHSEALAIYSDAKLTAVQLHKLRQVAQHTGSDIRFYGLHAAQNLALMHEAVS